MRKCAVRNRRKVSAGSKSEALCARPAYNDATSAMQTPRTAGLDACTRRTRGLPRRARQHETQDECGNAEQPRADEEESVGLDQRAADGEVLDPHAGEPLREFADVRV